MRHVLFALGVAIALVAYQPRESRSQNASLLANIAKSIPADQVLEGSEEISKEELAEAGFTKGGGNSEITTRGIKGVLIVVNGTANPLVITRGRRGYVPVGFVGPYSVRPMPVGDFKGSTKLWARNPLTGKVWRQTVKKSTWKYVWHIR